LAERSEQPWTIGTAEYMAFSGRRTIVPVIRGDAEESAAILTDVRGRLVSVLDGIAHGDFPPRPHDAGICRHCEHAPVCRKDYVRDA
jgi:hypothetical protein